MGRVNTEKSPKWSCRHLMSISTVNSYVHGKLCDALWLISGTNVQQV